jgi:hypothetical protein
MNWKTKLGCLLLLSIPAFSGYPLERLPGEVLSGLGTGWVVYWLAVNTAILLIGGWRFYANVLGVTAMITIPVVFGGGGVSYVIYLTGLGRAGPAAYSPHYLSLCITMLTVIPLSLSLVAVMPLQSFEHSLLYGRQGVSKIEKFALMFLRVFNHIVYFVIPSILEIVQEERRLHAWTEELETAGVASPGAKVPQRFKSKLDRLVREGIQLAVAGICSAIKYVPLWALEISQLPDSKSHGKKLKIFV